jgi:hypothetical protein
MIWAVMFSPSTSLRTGFAKHLWLSYLAELSEILRFAQNDSMSVSPY